jgi:hypothetical protein
MPLADARRLGFFQDGEGTHDPVTAWDDSLVGPPKAGTPQRHEARNMQTDDTIAWPAPVWPASTLETCRQLAAGEPDDAFTLTRIRLLAASGNLHGARQQLAAIRTRQNGRPFGNGTLRQLFPVALLIHDHLAAREFLAEMFATTTRIDFALSEACHPGVVLMRVESGAATFVVTQALFKSDHGEVFLQRLTDVYPILAHYLESPLRSDGTVAINLADVGETPGLAFCDYRPGYFMIPDSIFMDNNGYSEIRRHFTSHAVPWEQRSSTAFWRGATTGVPLDPNLGWRSLPRVRLCEIGAGHPDLIDAGITKVAQIRDPDAERWIQAAGLMRPHVPAESFQQYKYQIDIDGNTTSWPGLFIKLLTGSVVLKVPPRLGLEQWYYDRLKPWVNFIPLAPDMSDLVEKVRWLRDNDCAARAIGEAGYRLAEDLTYDREIERAAPTVAAAMRDASGLPLTELDFSAAGNGPAHLREGWLPPDATGVDTAGFQSHIEVPRPLGIGGCILRFEMSPAAGESQRLSVVINGEVLMQQRIGTRTMFYVPLAQKSLSNRAVVALTLLHPDAFPAACTASPGDTRILAVRLHRMAVMGISRINTDLQPDMAQALAELRSMDNGDQAQDLSGPAIQLPPATKLLALYTNHGTLAYADMPAGRLRHGPADSVPRNLFVADVGGHVRLLRVSSTGQQWTVRLRPEGPFAEQSEKAALDADGFADGFTPVPVEGVSGPMGMRAAGMVLCAEPAGELGLTRIHIGAWESFQSGLAGALPASSS